MHLIAVDAQRFVKMPLASLADISIVGVVVIHIFFFLFFFRCYCYPFSFLSWVSIYLSVIVLFNLFNSVMFILK